MAPSGVFQDVLAHDLAIHGVYPRRAIAPAWQVKGKLNDRSLCRRLFLRPANVHRILLPRFRQRERGDAFGQARADDLLRRRHAEEVEAVDELTKDAKVLAQLGRAAAGLSVGILERAVL